MCVCVCVCVFLCSHGTIIQTEHVNIATRQRLHTKNKDGIVSPLTLITLSEAGRDEIHVPTGPCH